MIWTKLKALFTKQKSAWGGDLPPRTASISECYAKIDAANWWQGDVYKKEDFHAGYLPTQDVPYWMLINRTCHLYEGHGRKPKLTHLNYIAVYPLEQFLSIGRDKQNLKNQITSIVKHNNEEVVFLPANPDVGASKPLVASFNLIYTLPIDRVPRPDRKTLQLASPFCEHLFQRFARYFYTVGFDADQIRSDENVNRLIEYMQQFRKGE